MKFQIFYAIVHRDELYYNIYRVSLMIFDLYVHVISVVSLQRLQKNYVCEQKMTSTSETVEVFVLYLIHLYLVYSSMYLYT